MCALFELIYFELTCFELTHFQLASFDATYQPIITMRNHYIQSLYLITI